MTLIPFLLEGVGGEPSLNQEDGIHPTVEGHKIVAENLWRQLNRYCKTKFKKQNQEPISPTTPIKIPI
jgi:hypothetical protein